MSEIAKDYQLKNKLRDKIKQKRVMRMNKAQKQNEINTYYDKLGVTPEQIKAMEKQLQKLKNNVPYR